MPAEVAAEVVLDVLVGLLALLLLLLRLLVVVDVVLDFDLPVLDGDLLRDLDGDLVLLVVVFAGDLRFSPQPYEDVVGLVPDVEDVVTVVLSS